MFTILKQQKEFGCIPTCAASVLLHHKIPGSWNESFIYKMYDPELPVSGFETLKIYLEGNGFPSNWKIHIVGKPLDFKQFVVDKNSQNIPLLCPINQGPGNNAHCVVVADSDENNLVIYDPHPSQPNVRKENYDAFLPNWAGSLLWFEETK